jgi:hypothetical protein
MLYRKFGKTNEIVSILGFGCMRLPLLSGGDPTKIDEKKAIDLIRYAIDKGVNYIDTAYPYHSATRMWPGGWSEPLVAKALTDGYREKVKLATKLPSWLIKTREDMDKYLNAQLERLATDSIDFYLVHALNGNLWKNLQEIGITDFLNKAIKDRRIKYAGFSFHDKYESFNRIVDAYDWSFCQIQYNYMDEDFQAGKQGLQYAAAKGLGITIMEPLKGGKLAVGIPGVVQDIFDQANIKRTPVEWALRWVWNHKEVAVLLSGMNTIEQVVENLKIANEGKENSLTKEDLSVIEKAKSVYKQNIKVPCTGCGYCVPCPAGVDIPACFTCYNNYYIFGREERYALVPKEGRASNCVQCGKCEIRCPQAIKIREELKNVKALFEK